MKALMTALVLVGCFSAGAQSITMICLMGHAGDMDIKIEALDGNKEKLTVILSKGMSGDKKTEFINTVATENFLTKSLKAGSLNAIVSETDLDMSYGGAYDKAGLLTMRRDETGRYDTQFAADSVVYTASCK